MSVLLAVLALLQAVSPDSAALHGVRSPAFASNGALAVSIDGDLYVRRAQGGALQRVTTGKAWDRDPAWSGDGTRLVFASDRGGTFDLWQVTIADDGSAGSPERLQDTRYTETSPTVARNGRIAFVRGSGNATRVWVRDMDGSEHRLNTQEQTESSPRFSADGARLAYIVSSEAGRQVVVRNMTTNAEQTANSDRNAERLAWSADNRIALSSRTGVYVVPMDGRWSSFASAHHGDIAWSPVAATIAIAEYDEVAVSYNGDPDRLGDRTNAERYDSKDALLLIVAPTNPDITQTSPTLATPIDRAARNADAYDRVWDRSSALYFSQPDAAARRVQWDAVKLKHRAAALAATNDDELQRAIHAMLRDRPTLRTPATGRAAVSSAHPVSTAAGLEILRAGGNVVDAAVAVSFALGVVEPDASGVGGYGEMLITLKGMARPTLIEFMSRVPEDAPLSNTSLLQNGRYPVDGPVLVNVPGTVAGMHTAWTRYGSGKVAWKDLLAPAIRAARDGYVVSEGLATTLATEREHFAKYEGSRALFFRDGKPLLAGDTLRNPDLAWVLEQIAAGGTDGFYKGAVAKKWVDDIHAKGNAMKLSDLARYFAPERETVKGTYRGYTLYSSAPPVSGGAELVARLNLLEQFPTPKLYTEDAATLHAALTAWFLVPSSRNRIADPSLWPVDIAPIVNRDTARVRWGCYNPDKALRPSDVRGDTLACLKASAPAGAKAGSGSPGNAGDGYSRESAHRSEGDQSTVDVASRTTSPCGEDHAREVDGCHAAGTTAFTVADNEGNAVAVTQTLGTWGGNFYVTPGLGFLSNDKLTSYGTDPTQYGSRLPFARHGSTLAPTIVFRGATPVLAVGAAGNAWITSAVYQATLGALDYGLDAQRALELPRFLPGGGGAGAPLALPAAAAAAAATPAVPPGGRGADPAAANAPAAGGAPLAAYNIQMEDGFSPDVIKRLRALGYDISFVSLRGEVREGYGAAITMSGKTVTAGADPRRAGAAGAIK